MEKIVRRLVKSHRAGAASADALFIGEGKPLGEDGDLSGIFKARVRTIDVGLQGVAGDVQVDRRYHGGPDRALHQYPVENYARLADAFPALREDFVPGCLGENVSSSGLCEQDVFVGDVVRLGTCLLQITQPRTVCWRIDHRFEVSGLAKFIHEHGLTGWLYRVLEPGCVREGDEVVLVERPNATMSLADLLALQREHRPDPARLQAASELPGLAQVIRQRFASRAAWLRDNR